MDSATLLVYAGFIMIFLGIAITIIALILLMFRSFGRVEKAKGGGIVLIGPFPIIFGTDKSTVKYFIWMAIAIIVIMIVFILTLNFLKT